MTVVCDSKYGHITMCRCVYISVGGGGALPYLDMVRRFCGDDPHFCDWDPI